MCADGCTVEFRQSSTAVDGKRKPPWAEVIRTLLAEITGFHSIQRQTTAANINRYRYRYTQPWFPFDFTTLNKSGDNFIYTFAWLTDNPPSGGVCVTWKGARRLGIPTIRWNRNATIHYNTFAYWKSNSQSFNCLSPWCRTLTDWHPPVISRISRYISIQFIYTEWSASFRHRLRPAWPFAFELNRCSKPIHTATASNSHSIYIYIPVCTHASRISQLPMKCCTTTGHHHLLHCRSPSVCPFVRSSIPSHWVAGNVDCVYAVLGAVCAAVSIARASEKRIALLRHGSFGRMLALIYISFRTMHRHWHRHKAHHTSMLQFCFCWLQLFAAGETTISWLQSVAAIRWFARGVLHPVPGWYRRVFWIRNNSSVLFDNWIFDSEAKNFVKRKARE